MVAANDSWVVISGAGGALGRALVSHFAAKGPVLALDRHFDAEAPPPQAVRRTLDLADEAEVRQALAEAIPASASIALLVNAVGLIWNEPTLALKGARLHTHDLKSWRDVIEANLTAPFVVATQVAARMVRRGGGAIVNFSSIASEGNPGQAAYSAAKAGIEGLTRTMAIELGPLGVRVNALALGFIDVATTREAVAEERLQGYVKKTPIGRLGQREDVINAIEFFASNTFANGTIVKLDGGLRL
ncbi:SDR family NAD(P)-dependent oxidoreductase [Bradyrhizobium ivorense]|uniref:SDR family NAD(P)-dependent oxidoreductase n=1 Tax=Bradyrhizobium ivorense TaxID=2511166 RepID=UPI0010BA4DB6|nr:SDR family oxidoreductase [Bradyrhizobium ivorense]VIO77462.1 3-oxoacyl-[acyl-carrier-protein] reductase FabG [Bradyrhizobium ivorense]